MVAAAVPLWLPKVAPPVREALVTGISSAGSSKPVSVSEQRLSWLELAVRGTACEGKGFGLTALRGPVNGQRCSFRPSSSARLSASMRARRCSALAWSSAGLPTKLGGCSSNKQRQEDAQLHVIAVYMLAMLLDVKGLLAGDF